MSTGSTPLPASAPVIGDGEPTAQEPVYKPLSFDPHEFMQFVVDHDLAEAEAIALLEEIWKIVVAFIDLGFGVMLPLDKSDSSDKNFVLPALALVDLSLSSSGQQSNATGHTDRGAIQEDS
jgi:hypothetical protein